MARYEFPEHLLHCSSEIVCMTDGGTVADVKADAARWGWGVAAPADEPGTIYLVPPVPDRE